MTQPPIPLISIVGPTASGKTGLALALAARLGAEIINVDSMQVYRQLQVGTDKPSPAQRAQVPFHMVDLIDIDEGLDAARFGELARGQIQRLHSGGKLAIAAGGTGLYHRALRFGLVAVAKRDEGFRAELRARREAEGTQALYDELKARDPEAAAKIHPNDWVRIERGLEVLASGQKMSEAQAEHGFAASPYRSLVLGTHWPRVLLYDRINRRLEEMWSGGLREETQLLIEAGCDPEHLPLKALGYRQMAAVLTEGLDAAEGLRLAQRDTRRYAKRQLTWFRREADVQWLAMPKLDEAALDQLAARCRAFAQGSDGNLDASLLAQ